MVTRASYKSVLGVFRGRQAAECCFRALIDRGSLPSEIGLMLNVQVRGTEFVDGDEEDAPSEDEVLVTGSVEPTTHEQVVRRAKELSAEGGGASANTTAVREADMHGDGGDGSPTLATLVDVATPFAADGTELLIFGLSFISAQSGTESLEIGLARALEGMGFESGDAQQIWQALKNNAIVLSIAVSDLDQSEMKDWMLAHSADSAFMSR